MSRSLPCDTLFTRLNPAFGDRLRTDRDALQRASTDESGYPGCPPAAVVEVANTADVVRLAQEAAECGVALVPRGAGTGKAGACIPAENQVVVDFSGMNRIQQLRPEDLFAVVEPGVITSDLDREAQQVGYMYPPDPASWESSTLGGNIATNAGGPRAVKYGVTHRYVWGLELVLAGGQVIRTGRQSIKGVAGLDLTSLMVGSEGTLAFITAATLHIIPSPPEVETGWLAFTDPVQASHAAERVFAAGLLPRMLELLDRIALDAVRPVSSFRIPEGTGAALLVETDGNDGQARQDLIRLMEIASEHGATDTIIATTERDREGMRRARRLVSPRLKERFPYKVSDDVAVPRSHMAELLEVAGEMADREGVVSCAYGHLGDGNLHVNLLGTPDQREQVAQVRGRILRRAVAMGGTVSGEHGIGLSKRDQLLLEQAPELIALQQQLKHVFDPQGVMNPGKIWPDLRPSVPSTP